MNCKKDHSDLADIMRTIPEGQLGPGRHKCAGCAYEKGVEDGMARKMILNISLILKNLPTSQAQPQRHKDAHIAYIKGYHDGLMGNNNDE